MKKANNSGCCGCQRSANNGEFEEFERRQCPMCNSLLIKKSMSPIRKSVENRLRNLRLVPKKNDSVSVETILRASSRNQLKEHNMILSPKK